MIVLEYKIDHIPKGKRRPGTITKHEYLTIHSTANSTSSAKSERAWLLNPSNSRTASWHICVDEKVAIEAIPLNETAIHSGTRAGNEKSIGIEICESGDRTKTMLNAVELVAKLLKERCWGTDKLKRHFDWSGKICPGIMAANNWDGWRGFLAMVERELQKDQPSNWAKEAWNWGKKEGITDGTDPKGNVTREQLVTMLYRFKEVK